MADQATSPNPGTPPPDPSNGAPDVLLQDARLVEEYVTSCGLLTDESFLLALEGARKAKEAGELDLAAEQYTRLRAELNKVMRSIHPVTIPDLREWDPMSPGQWRRGPNKWNNFSRYIFRRLSNGLIALLAVFIFLFTGFYSVWSQRAEILITEAKILGEQDRVEMERKYLTWFVGRIVELQSQNARPPVEHWVEGASQFDKILAFEQKVSTLTDDIMSANERRSPLKSQLERTSQVLCYREERPTPNAPPQTSQDETAQGTAPGGVPAGPPPVVVYRFQIMEVFCDPPRQSGRVGSYGAPLPETNGTTQQNGTMAGAAPSTGAGLPANGAPAGVPTMPKPPSTAVAENTLPPDFIGPPPAGMKVAGATGTSQGGTTGANGSNGNGWTNGGVPVAVGAALASMPTFFAQRSADECERYVQLAVEDIHERVGKLGSEPLSHLYLSILFDIDHRTELIENIRCARSRYVTARDRDKKAVAPTEMRTNLLQATAELERHFRVVSKWTLPSLYGALGAMVYTLGFMLSRIHPDPKFFRSIVRLMMGSLAGVTVVNFFTPEIANMVYLPVKSFGLLAIAFLAGFSIEVVMALLRGVVNKWSEKVSNGPSPA